MLANQNRIRNKEDFEKIKSKGNLFQSESFGLSVLERGDNEPSRFGFIVSTKISKDAHMRNKVKRCLSEAVRHSLYLLRPGIDCVFLAKPVIVKKYSDELMREVKSSLEKASLYK